jgi:hypothetical protein
MRRRSLLLVLCSVVTSMGAVQRTPNFVIHAPTPQIASQVAHYAEQYRREKAMQWLGEEMPNWPHPCPLHVTVTMEPPSGATTFTFGQGQILSMRMEIKGPLDRLLSSVLPHEITHTVFAHHFRCPLPRWADEGGSVLSEDDVERERHDKLVRNILNQGRQIRMRTLLSLKEYPAQVHCLYAQGFSITEFLVKRSDRRTFLNFVGHGMRQGWDSAVQTFYRHRNIEEMEEAWLAYLRDGRRIPDVQLARNQRSPQTATPAGTIVRLTLPPVPPLDPAPLARGAMPTPEQIGQRFGERALQASPTGFSGAPVATGTWQQTNPSRPVTPQVILGPPLFDPAPTPPSPPGFPR